MIEINRSIEDIILERARQDEKWGEQNRSNLRWLGILGEEFGDAARAMTEIEANLEKKHLDTYEHHVNDRVEWQLRLKEELIQTAAVCVAWLECMARKEAEGEKQ